MFWQTSIKDQRPQLKVKINNKVITSLVDTGADMTIITQKSWPLRWPLRNVNVQILMIGTLSRVCRVLGGLSALDWKDRGRLKPHVVDIAINLCGHDLLQ
ncbi:hypothetical protein ACQP3F_26705, partial [Escherichia coli]